MDMISASLLPSLLNAFCISLRVGGLSQYLSNGCSTKSEPCMMLDIGHLSSTDVLHSYYPQIVLMCIVHSNRITQCFGLLSIHRKSLCVIRAVHNFIQRFYKVCHGELDSTHDNPLTRSQHNAHVRVLPVFCGSHQTCPFTAC